MKLLIAGTLVLISIDCNMPGGLSSSDSPSEHGVQVESIKEITLNFKAANRTHPHKGCPFIGCPLAKLIGVRSINPIGIFEYWGI